MSNLSSGMAVLIGLLVLMIIVMIVVVFILVYKKVGGCSDNSSTRCGASISPTSSSTPNCPAYHPLPPGTKVSDEWIHTNISPCPDPASKKFCYYQGSDGNLCIDGAKHAASEDVCSPQWCPYGMKWTPSGCQDGSSFSNTRLSHTLKPLLTKSQRDPAKTYVEITSLDPSVEERYVPRPTLALYHGGVVGAAENDASGKVFSNYMATIAKFCRDKSIDTFLISLDSYTPEGAKGTQYKYLQDPSYLANIVDRVIHPVAPSTTLGVVAYVRPKDAGWTDDPMGRGGCIKDPTCGSTCQFIQPSAPGCPRYCTTDPNGVTPNGDVLCPPGCPNQLSQAISYVGKVNARIASGQRLEAFVFDGEDAGDYASGCGFSVAQQANKTYGGQIKEFGYAKALQAGVVCYPNGATSKGDCPTGSEPVSSMVFPETYWFMNDLWPCTGSSPQLASRPPVCTSQTSYQRFKNQPVGFFNYLLEADRCGYGSNGLVSLRLNLEGPYGDKIWPMFSLEKLSAVADPTMPGGPSSCLAMAYTGGAVDPNTGWPVQSDTCGTFDGFATWEWNSFLEFISLFAYQLGASKVGIYEAQFLPWSTTGGVSWVDPVDPLPPTVPKSCENDCSYCSFSCKDDLDCTIHLVETPSCVQRSTPNGVQVYSSYCENALCKIKSRVIPPVGNTCPAIAAATPCTTNDQCVKALASHPNCTTENYNIFCRIGYKSGNNLCQANLKH
jgi:hypothetical protein